MLWIVFRQSDWARDLFEQLRSKCVSLENGALTGADLKGCDIYLSEFVFIFGADSSYFHPKWH